MNVMTEGFTIDKPGEYVTRDCRKAVVLCVDAPHPAYNFIGYVVGLDGFGVHRQWRADGQSLNARLNDARDHLAGYWVEPVVIEEWVPVTKEGFFSGHRTMGEAKINHKTVFAVRKFRFDGKRVIDVTEDEEACPAGPSTVPVTI